MASIRDELNISEERYIEIKKMAYQYYEQYNSLERPYRRKFLDALPDLDTRMETDILLCTLLFPDTKALISLGKGGLMSALGKQAKADDNITSHNVTTKAFEYAVFKTKELIDAGKLKFMDEISYPDDSIPDKEYVETKETALKVLERFNELSLMDKSKIIQQACTTNTYQAKIQISTLLIPNDLLLAKQLQKNSIEDIAAYYKVPVSVIEFKKEEYEKQATFMLIDDGKLSLIKSNRVWHHDIYGQMDLINGLWDQSFYKEIENSAYEKINSSLKGLFDKPITKVIK